MKNKRLLSSLLGLVLVAVLAVLRMLPGDPAGTTAATLPPSSAYTAAALAEAPASGADAAAPAEASPSETGSAADTPAFDAADPRGPYEYTDAELLYWSAGTFDTPQDSLNYHFNKHGAELPAVTVADYLNQAYATRAEVLADPAAPGWKVTESSGANEAHKYKNREDQRFIILDDETGLIYSFGR